MKALVIQLCLTLWDPMDYSPPGSSVHGILQARILEWVAMPSSGGSSQPRDWTRISCTAGRFFTFWARWSGTTSTLGTNHSWDPLLETSPHPIPFIFCFSCLAKRTLESWSFFVFPPLSPPDGPSASLASEPLASSTVKIIFERKGILEHTCFFFLYSFEIYSLVNTLKEIYSSPKWKFLVWGKRIVSQNCGCWLLVEASGNN